ncbi:potassium voltage-gated channel subfamily E regulatory beta subunit 5 [Tiliqua scincoides]|uniref:potassium voltage-gated channel subfamily E regulatory beta subunit 5 n=1 Tax=Tiliqua scincoides TaxID=71010 RepID=UPI0034630FC6
MNCSEGRLGPLLGLLLRELRGSNGSGAPGGASARGEGEDDAYLYILLIMIFYGCLAGGLILAYTRSRKLESKHDPYHLYIERDWTAAAGRACAAVAPAGEAAAHADRRSSGESEPL